MRWPVDGGEMGERIRRHDWDATPLGPLRRWPQSLRTAVDLMLDAAQPMLIAWDEARTVLFNDHYLPILADKAQWALGAPFADVWSELWEEYRPMLEAVSAGRAYFFRDRAVGLTAGRSAWFTFSFTPLRDENSQICGMFNVATETTDKVVAGQALIDSMDEGFAIFDTVFDASGRACDFRWILTNPAFQAQAGQIDAVGRTLKEALPELEEAWFETFSEVVRTGVGARFTRESASEGKWYDCYAFRYGGPNSSQLGLLFRDVTVERRAEEAIKDESHRKDEFLAMLAHELRNPLAPIASGAELLSLVSHEPAQVVRTAEVIARQVRHMTGLVDDLLDVARVTRGHVVLDLEDRDLHAIVHHAIEQVRPLMETRQHKLSLRTATLPAVVHADSKRLVQTFANLLTNAAKYTPPGGQVEVELEVSAETVDVSVRDTGQGMSEHLLAHCFDLFVQAERTSERSAAGLGIGLALVRSLVQLHGGTVSAQSDGPGKGSRFTVSLPKSPTAGGPPASSADQGALRPPPRRLQVLIVDDNEDAAAMLAMLVDALGHETAVAHHPHRALERMALQAPDLCFLDVGLPEMDGYALAREINARAGDRKPVLVAVTGYGQRQDRDRALAAGFAHHYAKPISLTSVAEVLATL